MKGFILLFITLFTTSQLVFSQIAEVTFVRGNVTSSGAKVTKGQKINEGDVINTEKRSIAKLKFQDNTRLTIAPKSSMKVAKFEKGKPGLVSLLKGKIRAEVKKGNNGKEKLFVKTPSAAMGVRGTKLDAIYNPATNKSSVITYTGFVAFKQIAPNVGNDLAGLSNALRSNDAVAVRPGLFSSTDTKLGRSTIPVKINPVQLSTLSKNDNFQDSGNKKTEVKRSHLPPGLNPNLFINDNSSFAQEVGGNEINVETNVSDVPPPEGFFNAGTNEFAPPAGGYVSPNGDYIAPAPGKSYFDPVAQVYVPTTDFGSVDPATGNYLPPEGFALTATGEFVKSDAAFIESQGPDNNPENSANQPAPPTEGAPQIATAGEIGSFEAGFSGGEQQPDGAGFGGFNGGAPGGPNGNLAGAPGGPGGPADQNGDLASELQNDLNQELDLNNQFNQNDQLNQTTSVNITVTVN